MRYVSGSSSISVTNLSALTSNSNITQLNGITAKQMQGYSITGKPAGKDIVVTFAGLDFTPTYLSKDKSGNVILTIWLANSSQLAGKKFFVVNNKQEIEEYGWRCWNIDFEHTKNLQDKFPDSMYGTSFINAVILNNGGYYKEYPSSADEVNMIAKDSDNVFTPYTYNTNLTKYIVTPRQVTWQEFGQDKRFEFNGDNNFTLSNENWSTKITHDGIIDGDPTSTSYKFYTDNRGTFNYASKTYSDQWADSTLWLPSLSETGCSDSKVGIWSTSTSQRSNICNTFLRSSWSSNTYDVCGLNSYGTAYSREDVSSWLGVRPALHLNLTLAAKSAAPLLDERVSTNQSSSDGIYKVDKGSGVVDFHITSPKGLQYLSNYSGENLDNAWNKNWNYFLDADLDMTGYTLNPLGYSTTSCIQGTFDGQNHIIKNTQQLFGYARNFTVQNLKLHDCSMFISVALGSVTIKNVILTGESVWFYTINRGPVTLTNVQYYPSADISYLIANETRSTSTITITNLLAIVPYAPCFFKTVGAGTVLVINDSYINSLGSNAFKIVGSSRVIVDSLITNIVRTNLKFGGNVTIDTYLIGQDSCLISKGTLRVTQTTAIRQPQGFYTADGAAIKVYDPNFTDSLWCQAAGLSRTLPQLRQFLTGGNALPPFGMRAWANSRLSA